MLLRIVLISLAALVVLFVASLAYRSARATRPDHLGQTAGRLAPCPSSPNCVSSQATGEEHRIEPLTATGDPIAALARLEEAIEATPRARVVSSDDGYLHAEFTSLLFRYIDDVELLADPSGGVIHVRSASRTGHSDLGANRKRVEALRANL